MLYQVIDMINELNVMMLFQLVIGIRHSGERRMVSGRGHSIIKFSKKDERNINLV